MKLLRSIVAAALTLATSTALAQSAVDKGKKAYMDRGCWQCHGTVGQGAVTGPKLAPDTKPLAFMDVFIRNSKGAMPPYPEAILTRAELADIHAYLLSIPKSPDYKSIPLLNQ